MPTSTRYSTTGSASASVATALALADELRAILAHDDVERVQSFVATFAVRHRLTHRDVDALLESLARHGTVEVTSTGEEVTYHAPTADLHYDDTDARETLDDHLDWLFGDDPESAPPPAADDVVGQAFDDLVGDWSRTGGHLTRADVALLAARRRLTPGQYGELLHLLGEAGVELPDPTQPRPARSGTQGYEHHHDSVGQYLRAIARYPLIDAVREVELWALISQGKAAQQGLEMANLEGQERLCAQVEAGRQAHAELVCANLRLVISIAKLRQYEASGVEFADRIQDGNIGLMRAADKFDGSKGFKFSTYASWWIRQSIERGIGDRGRTIRLPIHFHDQVQKVTAARRRLMDRFGREPTLAEIADATGLVTGQVQAALDHVHPCRSLDYLLSEEGDLRLSDVLAPDEDRDGRTDPAEIVIHGLFQRDVDRTLRELLPERSAAVLRRRFGLGTGEEETLDHIGADYGVTRERIRQIEGKSMAKLRDDRQVAALRSYLVDDSKRACSVGPVGRKAS